MKVIEIIVGPKGTTSLQTKGFAGPSCREASRLLEAALGRVISDSPTPESYQSQDADSHLRQQHL